MCINVSPSPSVMRSEPMVKHFQMREMNILTLTFLRPMLTLSPMRSESLVSHLQMGIVDILSLTFLCVCLFLMILSNIDLNCRFVSFNTSLNSLTAPIKGKGNENAHILLLMLYLAIFEYHFIVFLPSEFFKNHHNIRWVTKSISLTRIFYSAFANCTFRLCCKLASIVYINIVLFYHYPHETLTIWIFSMRLILCPDIHPNPGPTGNNFAGGFLSFCNWNLNTLSKDDFSRINLLEAHNTEYNYDIISLCETSLDDKADVP